MLPSPTWPKAIGRMPGSRSLTAGVARVMNSATRLTGTETSCLIAPELFCASTIASRMRHSAFACAAALGDRPRRRSGRLRARCRAAAPAVREGRSRSGSTTFRSARTRDGARAADRSCRGHASSARSRPTRGISSKAVSWSPVAARARANSAIASSTRPRPRNAVSISRGLGNSLSVAAVMMPSVPSPPMKSCFRS